MLDILGPFAAGVWKKLEPAARAESLAKGWKALKKGSVTPWSKADIKEAVHDLRLVRRKQLKLKRTQGQKDGLSIGDTEHPLRLEEAARIWELVLTFNDNAMSGMQ